MATTKTKKLKLPLRSCRAAPCTKCPWRVDSARGWLGGSSPERFVLSAFGEIHLPCHMTINYENANALKDWARYRGDGKLCAGVLTFLRNNSILPRDNELGGYVRKLEPDHEAVFTSGEDFINHHRTIGAFSWSKHEDAVGLAAWKAYRRVRLVGAGLAVLAHFDETGEVLDD